jgi:hypothetical protein
MPAAPNDPGRWNLNNLGFDGPLVEPLGDGSDDKGQEWCDRRKVFARQERLEIQQGRRRLLGLALRWAVVGALPGALFGWGIGFILGLASEQLSPGWAAPAALVSLFLGAVGGALGGAMAGALFHSLFAEHRDVPLVVVGVMTLFVIGGSIYGAGQEGAWHIAVGLAVGIPVGIIGGVVVFLCYGVLKWACVWIRRDVYGS